MLYYYLTILIHVGTGNNKQKFEKRQFNREIGKQNVSSDKEHLKLHFETSCNLVQVSIELFF